MLLIWKRKLNYKNKIPWFSSPSCIFYSWKALDEYVCRLEESTDLEEDTEYPASSPCLKYSIYTDI